jgi:hypothetical protein
LFDASEIHIIIQNVTYISYTLLTVEPKALVVCWTLNSKQVSGSSNGIKQVSDKILKKGAYSFRDYSQPSSFFVPPVNSGTDYISTWLSGW